MKLFQFKSKKAKEIKEPKEEVATACYVVDFENTEFQDIMSRIRDYTLVDLNRCSMLFQFANNVLGLQGDFAEIGVYKGGTSKLLSKVIGTKGKTLHIFDTFEGMPETDPSKDVHQKGDFADTSLESVSAFLADCNNVNIYKGFFPTTAVPIAQKNFSFVHVDVDIYKSVYDCCEFFYPRLTTGGIMIFDDYGWVSCPGAKMAVDEFFKDKIESPIFLNTGQSLIYKL